MSKISGPLAFPHTWARIVRPSGVLTESGVYCSPAASAGRSIVMNTAMRTAMALALEMRVRRLFFCLMSTSSRVMVFDLMNHCRANHRNTLGMGEARDCFMLSQSAAQCASWRKRAARSVVRHPDARLGCRTQIVALGAKLSEQILGLQENLPLLRFTHKHDDDVVPTRTHTQDERIVGVRLPTYVGVRDVRGIKHVVRHIHGSRSREAPHHRGKHVGNSRPDGIWIGSPKSLRNLVMDLL